MRGPYGPIRCSAPSEIVLLSGHDLRRLLNPKVVIEALREAYAALADNQGIKVARSAS